MGALFFDFPGSGAIGGGIGSSLRAFLSLADSGDMEFRYGERNLAREAFLASIGIDAEKFVGLELAHSAKSLIVRETGDIGKRKADGLLSDRSGLCLGVTVADCMPIWIMDRSKGAYGILHSGWKGTGISVEALRILRDRFGTRGGDAAFILGPCIGSCCYEVPPERAVQFMDSFGADAAVRREGRWYLDLRRANQNILADSGVTDVRAIDSCTACDTRFGSFRRQGKARMVRMLAGIAADIPLDRPKKSR